jgi:hypothetical protein
MNQSKNMSAYEVNLEENDLGCSARNTKCAACVDDGKSYASLSPEAKAIFLANFETPAAPRSILDSTPLHATSCSHPSSSTACTATQPKTSWRGYLIYIIFGITVLASIIGVYFAFHMKGKAAKKFSKLQYGTHPNGKAKDPTQEAEMQQTRHELYKMTGAR